LKLFSTISRRACLLILLSAACLSATASHRDDKPKKPPRGAIILFDGKDTAAWTAGGSKPVGWKNEDGVLEVVPRSGSIVTKESYGDFMLHLEFNLASMPGKKEQSKSNSGVHLHGLYEIQILDSIDNPTYKAGACGSIYLQKDPDKNVCKAPGEWQTYDITFRAPRFDSDGKVTEKPRVTVIWNGTKVHDNVEINGPTHAGSTAPMVATGPISLQDHGCPVKFRNIWIRPIKPQSAPTLPP